MSSSTCYLRALDKRRSTLSLALHTHLGVVKMTKRAIEYILAKRSDAHFKYVIVIVSLFAIAFSVAFLSMPIVYLIDNNEVNTKEFWMENRSHA